MRQTIRNLQIILQGVGADLKDIVNINTYLTDADAVPGIQHHLQGVLSGEPPARTTIGCQLVGIQVEITASRVLPA